MSADSLLLAPNTRVTCPECEHEFSLEQGFAKQALESIAAASAHSMEGVRERERLAADKRAQQLANEHAKAAQRQAEDGQQLLKGQTDRHAKAMVDLRTVTEQAFTPQLVALTLQLTESQAKITAMDQREVTLVAREKSLETRVAELAATRAAALVAGERQEYQNQLMARDQQLADSRAAEVALRKDKAAVEDRAAALEVEVARKLDAGRAEIEAKVRSQEQERSTLREAEYQKTIEDMRGKLTEAQQKADQGSQQLQGEVLELAIEEGLKRAFPLDTIEEVKKGARGGDIIHRVTSRSGQSAGVILWETKRAQVWSPAWIAKLKEDMRACGAEMGVLVTMTNATPKEWASSQPFGLHEEVWVCTWGPALQLAEVLRAGLLDVHKQRLVSAGKGEKMDAVYAYVTSAQFAQKLQAVYGAFKKMKEELESEKSVTAQRWARREKQLQSGAMQLLGIGGDIQGIAQIEGPALELEHVPVESEDT